MPINNVGDNHNKQLVFGSGDIRVGAGNEISEERRAVVHFWHDDKDHEIGAFHDHPEKEVEHGSSDVAMIFDNTASIDVVIRQLQKARNYLADNKNDKWLYEK